MRSSVTRPRRDSGAAANGRQVGAVPARRRRMEGGRWRRGRQGTVPGGAGRCAPPQGCGCSPGGIVAFPVRLCRRLSRGAVHAPHVCRRQCSGLRLKDQKNPLATRFEERSEPHFPHFAYLLKAIERMMHTGKPTYPVERTLLTAGASRSCVNLVGRGQKRLTTPELAIEYRPVEYPQCPSRIWKADRATLPFRVTRAARFDL